MKYKYSDKLIKELQCYMRKRYNLKLDKSTCNQYLDSMAELYQAFIK